MRKQSKQKPSSEGKGIRTLSSCLKLGTSKPSTSTPWTNSKKPKANVIVWRMRSIGSRTTKKQKQKMLMTNWKSWLMSLTPWVHSTSKNKKNWIRQEENHWKIYSEERKTSRTPRNLSTGCKANKTTKGGTRLIRTREKIATVLKTSDTSKRKMHTSRWLVKSGTWRPSWPTATRRRRKSRTKWTKYN